MGILTHNYNHNIHSNIDNNNNTVSATDTHTQNISPHSKRTAIICNNFVSYSPSNIHSRKGDSVQ